MKTRLKWGALLAVALIALAFWSLPGTIGLLLDLVLGAIAGFSLARATS